MAKLKSPYADVVFNGKRYDQRSVILHGTDGPIIEVDKASLSELEAELTIGQIIELDKPIVMEFNSKYVVMLGRDLVNKTLDRSFQAYLLTRPRLRKSLRTGRW